MRPKNAMSQAGNPCGAVGVPVAFDELGVVTEELGVVLGVVPTDGAFEACEPLFSSEPLDGGVEGADDALGVEALGALDVGVL